MKRFLVGYFEVLQNLRHPQLALSNFNQDPLLRKSNIALENHPSSNSSYNCASLRPVSPLKPVELGPPSWYPEFFGSFSTEEGISPSRCVSVLAPPDSNSWIEYVGISIRSSKIPGKHRSEGWHWRIRSLKGLKVKRSFWPTAVHGAQKVPKIWGQKLASRVSLQQRSCCHCH